MATYYKWAERQADTTINWAEVGKNLSDTLKQEAQLREAKKAALDAETRALSDTLENMPMGDFEPANQFMLEFGGSAQETRLIQDNLLRAGMIKPKDFAIMRQNLNDGTNTMIDLGKTYQEEYQNKLARIDNQDPNKRSQAVESYLMERFEGLSNLTNTKAVINPTDGQVTLGRLVEKTVNGETVRTISDNPADVFTVNELNMRLKQKFDYFDVDSYMQKQVNQLGTVKTMMLDAAKKSNDLNVIYSTIDAKEGNYITEAEIAQFDAAIEAASTEEQKNAIRQRKQEAIAANSYLRAEKNMIESIMTSPLYVSSILTENMMIDGKAYTPELDGRVVEELDKKILSAKTNEERAKLQAERDSIVLFEKKSTGALEPVFTDRQKAEVYDYLKIDLRKRIADSEEVKTAGVRAESTYQKLAAQKKFKDEEKAGNLATWNQIYKTNNKDEVIELFSALTNRTGVEFDTTGLKINADGSIADDSVILAYNKDGTIKETIPFPPTDQLGWSEAGGFIHGITDRKDQISLMKARGFNPNYVKTNNEFTTLSDDDFLWKGSSSEIEKIVSDKPERIAMNWESNLEKVKNGNSTLGEEMLGDAGYLITQRTKTDDEGKETVVTVIVSADKPGDVLEQQVGGTINVEKIYDVLNTVNPKENKGVIDAYKPTAKKTLAELQAENPKMTKEQIKELWKKQN
jgi:hypothetical protein